jgi:hypothetical protein
MPLKGENLENNLEKFKQITLFSPRMQQKHYLSDRAPSPGAARQPEQSGQHRLLQPGLQVSGSRLIGLAEVTSFLCLL